MTLFKKTIDFTIPEPEVKSNKGKIEKTIKTTLFVIVLIIFFPLTLLELGYVFIEHNPGESWKKCFDENFMNEPIPPVNY